MKIKYIVIGLIVMMASAGAAFASNPGNNLDNGISTSNSNVNVDNLKPIFAADGQATNYLTDGIHVYDSNSLEEVQNIKFHQESDGKYVLDSSNSNANNNSTPVDLKPIYTPDGKESGYVTDGIHVYDAKTHKEVQGIKFHKTADGRYVLDSVTPSGNNKTNNTPNKTVENKTAETLKTGLPILVLGIVAVAGGIAYTKGRKK
ncbi:MAG: hypothetical protein HUK28_01305 [Methanobrevibacter sp.]|nr:hypothetical protein [Methanobrevibacter sp.]